MSVRRPSGPVHPRYALPMTSVDVPVRLIKRPMRERRWVWAVAVCVAVLLAACIPTAIWFAHWRSSLHSLVEYPTYGASTAERAGATVYFGSNAWPSDAEGQPDGGAEVSVHVSAVRPVVRENTAAARIVVLKCVRSSPGDESLGGDVADVRAHCATLVPFASGSVKFGERAGDDDIVLEVTPTRSGKVQIAGIEVRYSSGLRHGVQHIGARISIPTSG
jgi:hypothetical protein